MNYYYCYYSSQRRCSEISICLKCTRYSIEQIMPNVRFYFIVRKSASEYFLNTQLHVAGTINIVIKLKILYNVIIDGFKPDSFVHLALWILR